MFFQWNSGFLSVRVLRLSLAPGTALLQWQRSFNMFQRWYLRRGKEKKDKKKKERRREEKTRVQRGEEKREEISKLKEEIIGGNGKGSEEEREVRTEDESRPREKKSADHEG